MHAPLTTAGARADGFWTVTPEWQGETAFLVCGGPSVLDQNIEALRGRRVMVVNSSCYRIPWADILFFGDERWGREYSEAVNAFMGCVVSVRETPLKHPKISYLYRPPGPSKLPDGLCSDPGQVWFWHTSVRGAINLLCHLGVKTIVTLGLDGGPDSKGRLYHHANHTWATPDNWRKQREELGNLVSPLIERGVTLINASPGSSIPFWPIMSLADFLAEETVPC